MTFKAILAVDGKSFDVLECVSEMNQQVDRKGKVVSAVRAGDIRVVLAAGEDDTIPSWATNRTKKHDGSITFYKIDTDSKFREIKFKKAYITWYAESFSVDEGNELNFGDGLLFDDEFDEKIYTMAKRAHQHSRENYLILFRISAKELSIDEISHDNFW